MAEHARREANRLIAYHGPISQALTAERTSLESRLIPVTAYIVVACIEAWQRYPEMVREIAAAMPPEEIGRWGRFPGREVDTVRLWGVPNFYLVGRNVMLAFQPDHDPPEPTWEVLDFWERAALAFRADGHRQAWDADGVVHPYDADVVDALLDGTVAVGPDELAGVKRLNATLVNHLFLMWLDTRSGTGDAGPWHLPGGRTLLVRSYHRLARSHFPWSDVAEDVPYGELTAAFVLDGVDVHVTDFGSSRTTPEDYLDRVVRFGLFTTDPADGDPADGDPADSGPGPGPGHGAPGTALRPVPLDEVDALVAAVRAAQAELYRRLVAMDRDEKIRCGASVYFTFLRPFAEAAGVADRLDWTVPRDIPGPLYDLMRQFEGENAAPRTEGAYYPLIA